MIRAARPEDAEAIDRARVRAWHRAYGDFIAPEDMIDERRPHEERVARWRGLAEDHDARLWVFELDGFVAGFALVRGDELSALYVDPAAQGAGVGTALLERAEETMREQGAGEASLWVFTANEHGRRFYEARGWRLVGSSERPDVWVAPVVRYGKAL